MSGNQNDLPAKKLALVALVSLIGITPLAIDAAFTDWNDPAIHGIREKQRVHLSGDFNLTSADIAELEGLAAAHFIPDVESHPRHPHHETDVKWKMRIIDMYSSARAQRYENSDTYLAVAHIVPRVTVAISAELIANKNTSPEMRYAYYFLDQNYTWRPRAYEPACAINTWPSWYF